MLEVQSVFATVRRPKDGDVGQVTTGYYKIEDGVLIMTNSKGVPVRAINGDAYRHKLRPGDDPRAIAGVLTLEIHRMLRGEDAPGAVKGFGRQIDYPRHGVA